MALTGQFFSFGGEPIESAAVYVSGQGSEFAHKLAV
jgi:hypothetical protein